VYKVHLSLCLTTYQAMKTYDGVDVQLHEFLTSALYGGEWSALGPGHFTPTEIFSGMYMYVMHACMYICIMYVFI
jgi:hypothetical protein